MGQHPGDDVHPVAEGRLQGLRLLPAWRRGPRPRRRSRPGSPAAAASPTSPGPARPPGTGGRPKAGRAGRRCVTRARARPPAPRTRHGHRRPGRRAARRRRRARPSRPAPTTMRRGSVGQGQLEEQLAEAERRGMRRVAAAGVDQVGAARLGGLHVGGPLPVVVDDEDTGGYEAAGGVLDRRGQGLPAQRVAEDVEEPRTAVRHGREDEVVVRGGAVPAAGHRRRRLPGRERPGEAGRGEEDAHTGIVPGRQHPSGRRRGIAPVITPLMSRLMSGSGS